MRFSFLLTLLFIASSNSLKAINPSSMGKSVFEKSCLPCHNNTNVLNFFDKHAFSHSLATMQLVVKSGFMPPWYADTSYSRFKNEHVISKSEKKALLAWLSSSPANAALSLPPDVLAKPNLTLQLANGFLLPGDNKDHFVTFKVPYEIPSDTFVSSIQFVPKSKSKINHHLNYEIIPHPININFNPNPTYIETMGIDRTGAMSLLGLNNMEEIPPSDVFYGSWVPGMSPVKYVPPFAIFLPKKGYIIAHIMHYGPSPVPVVDSSFLNFYFVNETQKINYRPMENFTVGTGHTPIFPPLSLNPEEQKWVSSERVLANDIIAYSINPHMHLLGEKFIAFATYNGDTLPLIKIDNWNFNFQENYVFQNPLVLKRGTVIHIKGYFDNSSRNPNNPFSPPRLVSDKDGMYTTGEMLTMSIMHLIKTVNDDHFIIPK